MTIWLPGSKQEKVISETVFCSWCALSAEMSGAKLATGKWIRGKGTRLVWNSLRSTLSEPSKRRDAVTEDTTCAMRRLRFEKLGCATPSFCLQISKIASLSTW